MTIGSRRLSRNLVLALVFGALLLIQIAGASRGLLSEPVVLNLPDDEVRQLLIFVTSMAIFSVLLSLAIYKMGVLARFRHLCWGVWAVVTMLMLVVFLNIWFIAHFTFIQEHSFTSAVLLVSAGLSASTIGFFVAKTITDRLGQLHAATQSLAQQNLAVRLEISGNDEIAQLADTFNDMARKLQLAKEQKQQIEQARRSLTTWVAHDLRTPLASLRVMIEAILDGVATDEATVQRYLENSRIEIEHLSRLLDDLFELAQLDVGHPRLNMQAHSMPALIADTLCCLDAKAQRCGITLSSEIADDVDLVHVAPEKIKRVLRNLVDNAVKYSQPGERVSLRAWTSGDEVQVEIHNSGAAIPADVLPRVFESFYRGEVSRMSDGDGARGTGLGLAIARGLIEAHGGGIHASSSASHGTRFRFTLPKAQAPSQIAR